jgi:signal transduction histidine kinase
MKNSELNPVFRSLVIEDAISGLHRMCVLAAMILSIALVDYGFGIYASSFDVIYRELYLAPVLLGAFWFGLKGGLVSSAGVAATYLPCAILSLSKTTKALYLSNYVEIMIFILIGILLGALRDRERIRKKEKMEAVMAMAGSVRHELNNPLANALLAAEHMREEAGDNAHDQQDMRIMIDNLYRMKRVVHKITNIKEIKLKHYASNTMILDIDKASDGLLTAPQTRLN